MVKIRTAITAFFTLYGLIRPVFPPEESWLSNGVSKAYEFLGPFLPDLKYIWLKVVIVLAVVTWLIVSLSLLGDLVFIFTCLNGFFVNNSLSTAWLKIVRNFLINSSC